MSGKGNNRVTLDANNKKVNTTSRARDLRSHCRHRSARCAYTKLCQTYCSWRGQCGRATQVPPPRTSIGWPPSLADQPPRTRRLWRDLWYRNGQHDYKKLNSTRMLQCQTRDSPDTVEITVCIRRAIIVDDDVDTLNINTTPEDISGHKNTLLEGFERRVAVDT